MRPARGYYVSALRQELIARNHSYAAVNRLPHVTSYGEMPTVLYQPSACGRHHGNFMSASYAAIVRKPQWRRRLQKVHSHGRHLFPARDTSWRELDSSLSSDALLMNVFCYPGVTRRQELCGILGLGPGEAPEFGFMPRVPLLSQAVERTEIDMKLGDTLFEAKLTEADFQSQRPELVEQYRDFAEVVECRRLPRARKNYVSYQLIRNILAAYALSLDFCTLLDARRPDLLDDWYGIVCCVRSADLRSRCKILTWQELGACLPRALRDFLDAEYGILPAGSMTRFPVHRPGIDFSYAPNRSARRPIC